MEAHPSWYDPGQNFSDPRFALALRTGARAARVYAAWPPAEAAIASLWIDGATGAAWHEARPAVYHAWLLEQNSATPHLE